MVLDHKLRCPECQGTCEHVDLWKTFWSADGNAEARETEEDGSLVRARRLLRLRMRLQRAEHEAAAAVKALTESRESGASCAHVEAELARFLQRHGYFAVQDAGARRLALLCKRPAEGVDAATLWAQSSPNYPDQLVIKALRT